MTDRNFPATIAESRMLKLTFTDLRIIYAQICSCGPWPSRKRMSRSRVDFERGAAAQMLESWRELIEERKRQLDLARKQEQSVEMDKVLAELHDLAMDRDGYANSDLRMRELARSLRALADEVDSIAGPAEPGDLDYQGAKVP